MNEIFKNEFEVGDNVEWRDYLNNRCYGIIDKIDSRFIYLDSQSCCSTSEEAEEYLRLLHIVKIDYKDYDIGLKLYEQDEND
jgi:hypothetical protein